MPHGLLPPLGPPPGLPTFRLRRYAFLLLLFLVGAAALLFLLRPELLQQLLPKTPATSTALLGSGLDAERLAAQRGLTIQTDPPGAVVLIDFDTVGVTPLERHQLKDGIYILSVRKPNFAPLDTVIFVNGQATGTMQLALRADQGAASYAGLTDATGRSVPEAGGRSGALPVPATPAPQRPAGPEASPRGTRTTPGTDAGRLLVTSEPAGASVWLGEQALGATPLFLQEAPIGHHRLTIRRDGYEPYATDVQITPEETAKVVGQLRALVGTVVILVKPWGSIYIDGKLHKQDTDVQYTAELPIGAHRIRAVHPTLGAMERVVNVTGGGPQQLLIHFAQGPGEGADKAAEAPPASSGAAASGESQFKDGRGIYFVAEEPPRLVGGLEGLHRAARYPEAAYRAGLQGRVYLTFMVDEEGKVRDAKVSRGLGMGCDEEALRVIQQAQFVPGKVDGQPVKVHHALFINFRIRDQDTPQKQ